MGKKDCCGSHTAHDWSTPREQDGEFAGLRRGGGRLRRYQWESFEFRRNIRSAEREIIQGLYGEGVKVDSPGRDN
jgi:hypothetical protein